MSIPLYRISQISSVWNALASDNRKYITRIYKERFFIMNWIKKQRKHLRLWVQVLFTALTNGYVIGFTEGKIYRGTSKKLCVPGLNCYSCPGAIGSCPIGSLQAVLGSKNYKFSFYVIGFLMIFGSLMGRFVCGWLCPFGLVQDLLHKIPFVKKIKKVPFDRYLRYLKYVILVVFVIAMPLLLVGESGYGSPWFCKLICPARRYSACCKKSGTPACHRLFIWVEGQHPCHSSYFIYNDIPPFLQVFMSTWCDLWYFQPVFTLSLRD